MAKMPDKKTLLRLPLPKLPKHKADEDTCIVAAIEAVNGKWVLNVYVKKPKTEIRCFFSEGKWKTYIITEDKWSQRGLVGNYWSWKSWIDAYNHSRYKSDKDSIGAMGTYFGIGVDVSLYECLRAIENLQDEVKTEKDHKERLQKAEKRVAAKEMLDRLEIPPVPEKINPPRFSSTFCWQEDYCTVTYCPHCGETTWSLTENCPYCGSRFNYIREVGIMRNRYVESDSRTLQMHRQGETVYVVVYKTDKTITFAKNTRYLRDGFTATETEETYPLECYVFAPGGKIYTFYSWEGYGNNSKLYFKGKKWNYAGSDVFYNQIEFEPLSENELQGTVLANLHYKEYSALVKKDVDTLKYIEFFHKYPVAENLLMNGFITLLRECMYNPGKARQVLHLQQPRLYKMLGLNKDEQQRARREEWGLEDVKKYKLFRDRGKILPYNILKNICSVGNDSTEREVAKYADVYDVALYMAKQSVKIGISRSLGYWRDYITAAEKIDYDITDKAVLFPPDIEKAHDRAVTMVRYKTDEKLRKSFENLAEKYSDYRFEKDGICIRIAKEENELIAEGKILCHCVGGYGKSHISGKSIFFVRRADEPEKPWYTLQVNLKTGQKIQLHGYQNDRNTPIPQQVKDFVNYWLRNIFQPFDVEKMEFIKLTQKRTA